MPGSHISATLPESCVCACNQMYANPIVLNAVPVGSSYAIAVTRNVLITATMGNTLSGWDADTAAKLWSINLGPPLPAGTYSGYTDIVGPIGIVSTPVVDRTNRCAATLVQPVNALCQGCICAIWRHCHHCPSCKLLQGCELHSNRLAPSCCMLYGWP